MDVTAFDLAQRFIGIKETAGATSNPTILSMLRLDNDWPESDEVPWCSAFVNYIAWLLRLPRSKSLLARSWLAIGAAVPLADASPGNTVAILWRGPKDDGHTGHVGFFAGWESSKKSILVLGGNQSNMVSVAPFSTLKLLGLRRLAP